MGFVREVATRAVQLMGSARWLDSQGDSLVTFLEAHAVFFPPGGHQDCGVTGFDPEGVSEPYSFGACCMFYFAERQCEYVGVSLVLFVYLICSFVSKASLSPSNMDPVYNMDTWQARLSSITLLRLSFTAVCSLALQLIPYTNIHLDMQTLM